MLSSIDCVRIVLAEHIEHIERIRDDKADWSMFHEELRRVKQYDEERCPFRWQPAVNYVANHGWDVVELLKRYGERTFSKSTDDVRRLVAVYNFCISNGAVFAADTDFSKSKIQMEKPDAVVSMNLESFLLAKEMFNKMRNTPLLREYLRGTDSVLFGLNDRTEGIELLFGFGSPYDVENPPHEFKLCGVPKSKENPDEFRCFTLGKLDIADLVVVGERRFLYTFGTLPADGNRIIDALVRINGFPPNGSIDGKSVITYKLEERKLDEMHPTKAVKIIYDEANVAKDKGLFSAVKVLELVGTKIKRDPVIVGIDRFGNMHPLVYWAGDAGVKE